MKRPLLKYFALTFSLLLLAGVPLAWFLVAFITAECAAGPSPDVTSGPLAYAICVGIVATAWLLLAMVVRRRSTSELLGLCSIVSAGGAATITLSLLLAFNWLPLGARSAPQWEPNSVIDKTAFAQARAHAYGKPLSGNAGEYVQRRSWRLDEYGVRPDDSALRASGVWTLPWEEYGLPWRCFRSRYHFGWPRPRAGEALEWLPRILMHLALEPVPFVANTLFFSVILIVAVRGPRWLRWFRRASAGCCVHCGHRLTLDQVICPECGERVTPIDRLLVSKGK